MSTIASSGSNSELSAAATEIKNLMDDLAKYVVDNKDNLDAGFISGQMSIIKQKLNALKVNVTSFTNTWQPPTCNITCPANRPSINENSCTCYCSLSCAQELVPNFQSCRCSEYDDWLRFVQNRSEGYAIWQQDMKWDVRNQTISDEFYKNLSALLFYSNGIYNELVNNFDGTNLTVQSEKIEEFIANYTRLREDWYNYKLSYTGGTCPTGCPADTIPVHSCGCYKSEYTVEYYSQWNKFKSLSTQIENTFGTNSNRSELMRQIRFKFQDVMQNFINNYPNYDNATIESQLASLNEDMTFLEDDWNYYLANRSTTAPCTVTISSCTGDTIANLNTCKCDAVKDWAEVNTIKLALPDLSAEISGLSIDETNRGKLMDNWNVISSSITTLQNYVESSILNKRTVDIPSVENQDAQIIGWYNSLVQQINDIKSGGGGQSGTCSITCPTNWVVDSAKCACSCSASCPNTQAIDYFHCNCAEKNSCTTTCTGTDVLDYANCVCQPHP